MDDKNFRLKYHYLENVKIFNLYLKCQLLIPVNARKKRAIALKKLR